MTPEKLHERNLKIKATRYKKTLSTINQRIDSYKLISVRAKKCYDEYQLTKGQL